MADVVERVAEYLYLMRPFQQEQHVFSWLEFLEHARQDGRAAFDVGYYRIKARGVMALLRNPTPEMMFRFMNPDASEYPIEVSKGFGMDPECQDEWWGDAEQFKKSWAAAFDEALK